MAWFLQPLLKMVSEYLDLKVVSHRKNVRRKMGVCLREYADIPPSSVSLVCIKLILQFENSYWTQVGVEGMNCTL